MAMANVPPMGWNSWNTFSHAINEDLIKEAADAMVEQGLKDAGYEYIVIDDCWSLRKRDENGKLVADPEKFPNGMKALADYVHSKGLKFGMYSCVGTQTCAGFPGSLEHEFDDAATFAEWGVDFLKYDYCHKPRTIDGPTLYRRMSMALRNCGRDILFSACNWGADHTTEWIRNSGAHMYRSTGDIVDSWQSIKDIAKSQFTEQKFNAPYCFNDMDMLVVGMYGKSHNDYIAAGGCDDNAYRTHFSMWAMMNSPLMIGCDIRNMTEETKNILTNKDIIALNQDIECRTPYIARQWEDQPDTVVRMWKPLENGDYAIAMFNLHDDQVYGTVEFWDMGLPTAAGYGFELYDCWEHKSLGVFTEDFCDTIPGRGCRVLRAKLVKV